MNRPLHPAQVCAFEKLKRLRVGALYMELQEGMLQTVLELADYRVERGRVDGVLWLCTRRRLERLREGVALHAPELADCIELVGIESLSHNLAQFCRLMERVGQRRTMLVIDNGLLIKNGAALRTQRVLALSARCSYRLLISEVPFTRSVADMFTQWYALDWRILGYQTYWAFCINHMDCHGRGLNVDYLVRAIEPYCAQIRRADVQPEASREEYVWQFRLPQEAMEEYRRVFDAFIWNAAYTNCGVYRLLQACQHVACGRRVVREYPLTTEPMYASAQEDPRIRAMMEVLRRLNGRRTMILCRYVHECATVSAELARVYGDGCVSAYPGERAGEARFVVMNVFADERAAERLCAEAIVYFSSDWNWRKRQEKEQRCQSALNGGKLTVVSLAAADTIDTLILSNVWNKDKLIANLRRELDLRLEQRHAGSKEK